MSLGYKRFVIALLGGRGNVYMAWCCYCVMVNRNDESGRRSLLLVEDKFRNTARGYEAAVARGYKVDVAFDLVGAKKCLENRCYDGIITDLGFRRKGVDCNAVELHKRSVDDIEGIVEDTIKDAERRDGGNSNYRSPVVVDALYDVLGRSKVVCRDGRMNIEHDDSELGERIADEIITKNTLVEIERISYCEDVSHNLTFDRRQYGIEEVERRMRESAIDRPPLGYEVIKYAQAKDIPVVAFTKLGHGTHFLPALFHTGLASAQKMLDCYDLKKVDYSPLYEEFKRKGLSNEDIAVFTAGLGDQSGETLNIIRDEEALRKHLDFMRTRIEKWKRPKALYEENLRILSCNGGVMDRNNINKIFFQRDLNGQHSDSFYLDRAIILKGNGKKDQLNYGLAIDMLEGKINETRPYEFIKDDCGELVFHGSKKNSLFDRLKGGVFSFFRDY